MVEQAEEEEAVVAVEVDLMCRSRTLATTEDRDVILLVAEAATIAIEAEAVAIEIATESVIEITIESDIEFVIGTEKSRREREKKG